MIAAWVLAGLIVAFLALKAWADTGDAIAEDAATSGPDEPPLADTPGTRVLAIALNLVAGLIGLGAYALLGSLAP